MYEGKRTLPLVHLLANATGADRALVRDYLRRNRSDRSSELVRSVRALMDDYGSITFTTEYAEGILLVAEEYFEQAFAKAAQARTSISFGLWCPMCGPAGVEPQPKSRTFHTQSGSTRTPRASPCGISRQESILCWASSPRPISEPGQ